MTSWVWNHVTIWAEDAFKADCGLCGLKISRGTDKGHLTTSSIIKHLGTVHGIFEPKKKKDDAQGFPAAPSTESSSQPTIVKAMEKLQKFHPSHARAQRITTRIGEMIGADFMPYSVVENPGFQRVVRELEPRYEMPSRTHITETVVPRIYNEVCRKIKDLISAAEGPICATTDIWSSRENHSFMSVTANFIAYHQKELTRFTPVLCCKELPGQHNAEAILNAIRLEQDIWGAEFAAVVSDNGSNVTKALADGGFLNIRCMAHTVNLCVCHALEVQRTVKEMISASRSIVGHYHRSNKDAQLLTDCQKSLGAPQHKLIADVSTRWNSTFYMLERLVEQREAINAMSYKGVVSLTTNQWRLAASLVVILKIFEQTTKEISFESATISGILPAVHNMVNKIDGFLNNEDIYGLGTLMEDLKDQVQRRFLKPTQGLPQARDAYFRDNDMYENCAVASILDPRVKLSWCPDMNRPDIESLVFDHLPHIEEQAGSTMSFVEEVGTSSDDDDESMIYPQRERNAAAMRNEDRKSVVLFTLNKFLSQPPIKPKRCPLKLWEKYRDECPELFQLAIGRLSCPLTSVDSERLFSSAGIVTSPLRNRLAARNVEILTFLHVNLKKMNFQY